VAISKVARSHPDFGFQEGFFAKIIKVTETFVEGSGEEGPLALRWRPRVRLPQRVGAPVAAVPEAGGAAAALGTAASLAAILAFIPGVAADIAAMIEAMSTKSARSRVRST
jgi:hypothetical protein